jgi:hypothetical protein
MLVTNPKQLPTGLIDSTNPKQRQAGYQNLVPLPNLTDSYQLPTSIPNTSWLIILLAMSERTRNPITAYNPFSSIGEAAISPGIYIGIIRYYGQVALTAARPGQNSDRS